jgi:hypothetical protein
VTPNVRGAYGLRLEGLEGANELLLPVPEHCPVLSVSDAPVAGPFDAETFGDGWAHIPLIDGHWASMTRDPLAVRWGGPVPPPPGDLVHPWLADPVAVASTWLGRLALHGGVVAGASGALGILGVREAGKSSLLAALAESGDVEVLADDLIVVDGEVVHAGPRCLDLRPATAARHQGSPGQPSRGGSRWRMLLPPARHEVALRGFLVLEWGSCLQLTRESTTTGFATLLSQLSAPAEAVSPARVLGLSRYPVWRLTRPRTWESQGASAQQVMRLVC